VREQQITLEAFRSLAPIEPRDLVGLWKGRGIPAGHPFDGVLENLGWFGKRFTPDMRADALLFRLGERVWSPSIPNGYRFPWRCVCTCSAGRVWRKTCFPIFSAGFEEGAGRFAEDEGVWRNREFGDGL